jgi:hypothetical protein
MQIVHRLKDKPLKKPQKFRKKSSEELRVRQQTRQRCVHGAFGCFRGAGLVKTKSDRKIHVYVKHQEPHVQLVKQMRERVPEKGRKSTGRSR